MVINGESMAKKRFYTTIFQGIFISLIDTLILFSFKLNQSCYCCCCNCCNNMYVLCRNYFRCTHKHDQGCKATKQVQKIREEPPLHKTTYYGHHTCKVLLNPEIIVDSLSPSDHSSMFLSFDNSFPTPTKQDCPFLSSSGKRECKKEDNILVNIPPPPPPSSSNNDYLSELTFDESSTLDSDHLVVDIPHILYGSSGFDEVLNWTLS